MNRKLNIKPIAIVIIAVGFLFLLKSQFPHYKISSNTMSPSLIVGDVILVNNFVGGVDIKNNDVCVFEMKNKTQISRIVGLPGDKVEIIDGTLYINDVEELEIIPSFTYNILLGDHPPLAEYDDLLLLQQANQYGEYTAELTNSQAKEMATYDFLKSIHKIIHPKGYQYAFSENPIFPNHSSFNWSRDNFGPIIIPKKGDKLGSKEFVVKNNYYFALGDNRHQSKDSRYWGFISEEKIKGKMVAKIY